MSIYSALPICNGNYVLGSCNKFLQDWIPGMWWRYPATAHQQVQKGKKQAVLLSPHCLLSCTAVCMWIGEIFVMPFSKYCSRQYWRLYQQHSSSLESVFSSHWRAFKGKIFHLWEKEEASWKKQLLEENKITIFDFKKLIFGCKSMLLERNLVMEGPSCSVEAMCPLWKCRSLKCAVESGPSGVSPCSQHWCLSLECPWHF